jgi:hypothetical protein
MGRVELLGPEGNVVGTGVLQDNIKCGMELNAVKLCPFEVAVQVVRVLEESVWTGEIVGERLGQIGRRGGMQCLLCNGIRIFLEAF